MSLPSVVPGSWLRKVGRTLNAVRNMRVCLNCYPYNTLRIGDNESTLNVGLPGELCECGGTPNASEISPGNIDSATCVSKTGSGQLRGWSKFQNATSGDWNQRKAIRRTVSGDATACFYGFSSSGTSCGSQVSTALSHVSWMTNDGYFDINVSTNTLEPYVGTRDGYVWSEVVHGGPPPACGSHHTQGDQNLRPLLFSSFTSCSKKIYTLPVDDDFGDEWTHNETPRTNIYPDDWTAITSGAGCTLPTFNGCTTDPTPFVAGGSCTSVLSNFDTVAAALARGSPTTSNSCKTVAGSLTDIGGDASTQEIYISSTTAVTVTFELSDLTSGADYNLEITISRYTAGGGGFVDTITDTVQFTASGTTDTIEYEVPVNTDYDYEYTSATISPA